MAASSAQKDPTDELQEEELPGFFDDGGDSDHGPPESGCAESAEDLFEPKDAADDLHVISFDGPSVFGRGVNGKFVYSYSFAHPGQKSIDRGLCSPSDLSKQETMERVQKAYEACNVDLQETAAFREPHKNDLPHDAVLCRSSARHKWLPICTYMYDTWKMRMGASKHIKTWSDGCRYFRTPKSSPQTKEEGRLFSKFISKSRSQKRTPV